MTKMFGNLTTNDVEEFGDRLGGGAAIPTDVYEATIKCMYAGQSAAGANSVTLLADINGQEYRETLYITTKTGDNFYLDKADLKTKRPLPGFTTINDLCLMATGANLSEQDTEAKVIKIYNFEQKAEVPTEVPVLTAATGKKVKLGIQRIIENKQKKGDDGKYHDTNETRQVNEIDKVFRHECGRTVTEIRREVETSEFLPAWTQKNQGKDRDKTSSSAGSAGASGQGKPLFGGNGAAAAPKPSGMFGPKT